MGDPIGVTSGSGTQAIWAPDMSALYYRDGSAMWVVEIETQPNFRQRGPPRRLFDGPYEGGFDIHPSAEEFVMTKRGGWQGRMVIVQNFFETLNQLVPN